MSKRIGHADGDVIMYKAGFACQKMHYKHKSGETIIGKKPANEWSLKELGEKFNPEDWKKRLIVEPWKNCRFVVNAMLEDWQTRAKCDSMRIFMSDHHVFRHDIATVKPYKDRKQVRPHHYEAIKSYLRGRGSEMEKGLEADDLMGIHQTEDTVIITIDKDLDMIPGWHFNPDKEEYYDVPLEAADDWFYVQLLAGDSTDNIQGIPKMGVAKAIKLMEEIGNINKEDIVDEIAELYELHYEGQGQAIMEEMAQLVYITNLFH